MVVLWLSAGVSSFIAGYLEKDNIDKVIYMEIDEQDVDSYRFIKDFERVTGLEVEMVQSPYKSVVNVVKSFNYINNYHPQCSKVLKLRERLKWESENPGRHTYIWGFDCSDRELDRFFNIKLHNTGYNHIAPLIHKHMSKQDAHGMLNALGVKRPRLYDLGFQNNNCYPCIRGGMWYWNKIRKLTPEIFDFWAKLEREVGHSILKKNRKPLFLDELDPSAGRKQDEISVQCGVVCSSMLDL